MTQMNGPLRVGIGGPVGAGKTTLTAALCEALRDSHSVGVITNDIYTQEDAEALMRMQVLPQDRIIGVETGGCPHTAIREDASINLAAVAQMVKRHPEIEVMERDATRMRAGRPFLFTALRQREGVDAVVAELKKVGGLT